MTANYVLLEKITVGSAGASSVTFSGIPQTGYTDLVVKATIRSSRALYFSDIVMEFNASTTGYTTIRLYGDGSSPGTNTARWTNGNANGQTSNTYSNFEAYIPNYSSSNNKSWSLDHVAENNATEAFTTMQAGLWSNTAAITSITIKDASDGGVNSLLVNSTFYLYGVAKLGTTPAIVPYATGGDTIMTDGTYWYHTFLSSGTFTPAKAITCDYLVVAGGGGGGSYVSSGGGGAGGLRSTVTATGGGGSLETALSLGASAYTVTIGAGGAGQAGATQSANGSNSVFSTITATGGGGGGGYTGSFYAGKSGGSGGGGPYSSPTSGGTGTANQGYAGGSGIGGGSPNDAGGGGGGAGAVGVNATSTNAGNGGAGVAVSISGSSVTYAGGGGGSIYPAGTAGTGGSGGGGNGVVGLSGSGSAGTANTGSGGGASASGNVPPTVNGGNGGSGIVIVRYAV